MASDVGQRYARALLDVTEERKETEKASAALQVIAGALKNDALEQVLLDPRMRTDRFSVFEALAQKAQAPVAVISLLRTLDSNERLNDLASIAQAFIALADVRLGRVRGKVTSAVELTEQQRRELQDSVTAKVGKQVALEFTVDAALVGGVIVKVQDLVWDGSVKTQLDRMRTALRS